MSWLTMMVRSGASGVILSFLVGALTGAAAAVLLAPRSGRETREILGEKWRDAADQGRHLGEQAARRAARRSTTPPATSTSSAAPSRRGVTGSPPRSRPASRRTARRRAKS